MSQVTYFLFANFYLVGLQVPEVRELMGNPESYDGFWLNFDPDRLNEIEKDIVKRVVIPKEMYEVYQTNDFRVCVTCEDVFEPEKAKKRMKEEINKWKNRQL